MDVYALVNVIPVRLQEWWTHLWLNEGYASFVEFLCVEHLFPEYDIWTQFVTDTYCSALELDCLNNSHPIEVPVGHPSEIDEIFDDISYNKGASVIRMLHKYLGDEVNRFPGPSDPKVFLINDLMFFFPGF